MFSMFSVADVGFSCWIFEAAVAPVTPPFGGRENAASDAVTSGNGPTYSIIDR